jgi:hypothetical protein
MVEAGAEVPADSRFFLNLAIRAHLIPAKDIVYEPDMFRTVAVTVRPKWTHASFLAGLGVRL